MSLENYEGTAIDTSNFIDEVQPDVEPETEVQTEVVETVDPEAPETTEEPAPTVPAKINVEGVGEFTPEEIKELKQSGLRQADYTKKTQEIARQREQMQQAVELFEYLQNNPQLVAALKEAETNPNPEIFNTATPEAKMIQQLAYNQKAMEVDFKLNDLKAKYGDVDEVSLFQKASELHTDDLEFVYKALKYDGDKVDKAALMEEAKRQLKAELEADKNSVSTTIANKPTAPVQATRTLTEAEKRVANGLDMTEAEYLKWSE